jgi:hypothetical protein
MFSITGRVTDGISGMPVPSASVHDIEINGPQKHATTCGPDGRYDIATDHQGMHLLTARAPGYTENTTLTTLSTKNVIREKDFVLWPLPHPAPIFVDFGKLLLTLTAGALVLMNTFVLNAQLTPNQKSIAATAITAFALALAAFLVAYFLNLAATHDRSKRANKRWVMASRTIPNLAIILFALGFALSTALALWILLAEPPAPPLTNPW